MTAREWMGYTSDPSVDRGQPRTPARHAPGRARQSGDTEVEKIEALVLLLAADGPGVDDSRGLPADGGRRLHRRPMPPEAY